MISSLYVKAGIAALLLALGFWSGCSVQASRDNGKLEAADKALNAERQQVAILAATLVDIDEQTAAAKEAADARQKAAEQAGKAADKAETIYRDQLVYVDREIQEGKRQPVCRAQLEAELCVPLH